MIFRKALPADLDGIMIVVHEAQSFMATLGIDQWQDGYPSREIITDDIRIGQAYVCEDDGCIVSITVITAEPEPIYDSLNGEWHFGSPYLTIHRMAVSDACRHKGTAQLILQNAVKMAREQSLSGIRADTHRGNKAMRRFLEKNGFLECGTVVYEVDAGDPIRVAYDLNIQK